MERNGIICLETEWEHTKKDNKRYLSSEPLMRFLEKCFCMPYIYRIIATREELVYYLRQFNKADYRRKYGFMYFNFHGWTHGIQLEGDANLLPLNELQEIGGDVFRDRFVHFSSCRTFLGSQSVIDDFKEKSGAMMVSGYTKSVDAVLSSIFDIALIQEYQNSQQIRTIIQHLNNRCGGLQEELGFRTNTI